MLGWLIRALMLLAGFITSWFIARDELKFNTIQMVIAILLFTLVVAIAAFWPAIRNRVKKISRRMKGHSE